MYNLEVYTALTDTIKSHEIEIEKAKADVSDIEKQIARLTEALNTAKNVVQEEEEFHEQLKHASMRFSPNSIDRILSGSQPRYTAKDMKESREDAANHKKEIASYIFRTTQNNSPFRHEGVEFTTEVDVNAKSTPTWTPTKQPSD